MLRRYLPASVILGFAMLAGWWLARPQPDTLAARLAQIMSLAPQQRLPCSAVAARQPLVLLALGQSNAGNHGQAGLSGAAPVMVMADGHCGMAHDPLPGGTGRGASIWQRLPDSLAQAGERRPVVLAVLAVDASTIADWTATGSALRQRLRSLLVDMRSQGLPPDLVLWQQGEADAQLATSAERYRQGLTELAATLTEAGSTAPMLLALSTRCRNEPDPRLRAAILASLAVEARMRPGPDTDQLAGPMFRYDGCHFTQAGLQAAADSWAAAIHAQRNHSLSLEP